jgi:uncharacterized protein (DUF1499 family)
MSQSAFSRRRLSPIAVLGLVAALAALAIAVASGFGNRIGLWDYRTGLQMLRWGAWSGLAAVAVSLAGCFATTDGRASRGLALAAIGIVVGALTYAVPDAIYTRFRHTPRVWDITTDTVRPPSFVAIMPLRAGAPNPPEYRATQFAAIQKKAYPDIVPVELRKPPADAFRAALAVARSFGWTIIASVPEEGRIEAVDTTFWFAFKDDIVIRVAAREGGSRIDIRSYSRLGRNDGGKNAARVRAFIARLKAEAG